MSVLFIVEALTSAAQAVIQDLAPAAMRDAYDALRGLLRRKLGGRESADTVLNEHAKDPDGWKAPLEKLLKDARADADAEIAEAARRLSSLAGQSGGVTINVGTANGAAISGTGTATVHNSSRGTRE
jgi:hypothetical protein